MDEKKEIKAYQSETSLTSIEQRINENMKDRRIGELSEEELSSSVSTLVMGITKMVGIKKIDEYQATLFHQFLRKYFFYLSVKEIKLAFELSIIGELNNYLPRDKNGTPDIQHYQNFSMEYVSKILKAYRKKRSFTRLKQKELPEARVNKETIRKEIIKDLINSFEKYRDEGIKPTFILPFVQLRYLKEYGVIDFVKEPDEATKRRMLENILQQEIFTRKSKEQLKQRAEKFSYYERIIEVFDELIKNGENLKDYFA